MSPEQRDTLVVWTVLIGICWLSVMVGVLVVGAAVQWLR